MEHIGDILKKTTLKNIPAESSVNSSGTEEDISPSVNCDICRGAGFVHPALPSGKPDYSRVVACKCLSRTTNKSRQIVLEKYSNLGSLKRLTFANLIPQGRSGIAASQKKFEAAVNAAVEFAPVPPDGWYSSAPAAAVKHTLRRLSPTSG
jgi:hypothetical protein